MSSLPPYNPAPSERRVWLINNATLEADREPLLATIPDVDRLESDDLETVLKMIGSGGGDLLVIAPEGVLEELILGLVGGRPGKARLRFLPGAMSQVQILPDRAVVRHLNPGAFF